MAGAVYVLKQPIKAICQDSQTEACTAVELDTGQVGRSTEPCCLCHWCSPPDSTCRARSRHQGVHCQSHCCVPPSQHKLSRQHALT